MTYKVLLYVFYYSSELELTNLLTIVFSYHSKMYRH